MSKHFSDLLYKFYSVHLRHAEISENETISISEFVNRINEFQSLMSIHEGIQLEIDINPDRKKDSLHWGNAEFFVIKHKNTIFFEFSEFSFVF